jgi:hypothetical protein
LAVTPRPSSRRGGGADSCPAIRRTIPALDRTRPNHFHFASTLRSWLSAVEDVLRSVADLQAAINRFLDSCNTAAKPFIWTADPDKIIVAVR